MNAALVYDIYLCVCVCVCIFQVLLLYVCVYSNNMFACIVYCFICQCSYACVFVFQTQNAEGVHVPLKHQLLRVIVRVLQYRMILTGEHCMIQIFSPDDIFPY